MREKDIKESQRREEREKKIREKYKENVKTKIDCPSLWHLSCPSSASKSGKGKRERELI